MEKHLVRAWLLQHPRVECDGKPLNIRLKKAQALLFYLLVQKKATREEAAGLLWGGEEDSLAHRHLRDNLYQLKKAAPVELLRSLMLLRDGVTDDVELRLQSAYAHDYIGEAYRKQGAIAGLVVGGVFVLFALSTGFNIAGIGGELLSGILSGIVLVVVSLATQPKEIARALMLIQLMSIGKGYSAVSLEMLEQVRTYLNADLYPYAPCEGTIGGLSFQPYIAITYMGEGRLIDNGEGRLIDNGKVRPTAEVLAEKGIAPLKVKAREGLALLSNASHSLGVGLLALYDFVMTMRHADLTAALVCEALRSTDKAYDPRLIALKNHKETTETAQFLRDILSGSAIMDESRSLRVQDSMNTRIIPHVHGIAKRMAGQTYDALMEELYSVFDNPIFLPDGTALMGSNWDATAIELYCDSLAIAVMDVAKLTEVHMERLVDPHLSGLPAFLVKNPGLNNGFMIPQYVTAGLLGDIALLCAPAAAFNAAVSAGQESPVYRDDTAARQLYQAVQKLRSLVSMTMLTALQAIDLSDHKAMSPVTQKVHDHARQTVTFMENDDLMYQRIEAMEHLVESNQLLADCPLPFTI